MNGTKYADVFCESCNWAGHWWECPFGHNTYVCPRCGKETIVELPAPLQYNHHYFDEKSDEVYRP